MDKSEVVSDSESSVKVPLTCKFLLQKKGSVLSVEKFHGTFSCKQWLHGEEVKRI